MSREEVLYASRSLNDDLVQTEFSVPKAHCGGCIASVEGALTKLEGVVSARLNLSTRRVSVRWRKSLPLPPFIRALQRAGYKATLSSAEDTDTDPEMGKLVRATAVAGFAVMNIMLLSVSVWAGAEADTRRAFHLISALLAVPAVAYSGRIFFQSAWFAVRVGRTNMDVPISVGILLTLALSLHDTFRNGPHAYFDAVVSLIFILLIGRTLDHMMRRKARTAVLGLARLTPRLAMVLRAGGQQRVPIETIEEDEIVLVAAGDRIPLDGIVLSGAADVDTALVNGEAAPVSVCAGAPVLSGMLNLNGLLKVKVTRTNSGSFISGMVRLMEEAERGRARYRQLADRAAALYSPVVHSLAAVAFGSWMMITGDWHHSLTVAISVLIITCPCALGLAVPMVQVMAARRLFERGIALKEGSALERLAEVDTVVFDKTGTLTLGELQITDSGVAGADLQAAIALSARSRHPVARAVAALDASPDQVEIEEFVEHPGQGIEGRVTGNLYRLGRPEWALNSPSNVSEVSASTGAALSRDGVAVGFFAATDAIRPQSFEAIDALRRKGHEVEMLSGDRDKTVDAMANSLEIAAYRAGLLPEDKIARLEEIVRAGKKVLMVGDGLNDAPALSAAHVSMAPANAADIGRAAADLVFFESSLMAVPEALDVARQARDLIRQNLVLAVLYNLLVIPVALLGFVTPLMAALAMSLSSMLVVANALRLTKQRKSSRGSGNAFQKGEYRSPEAA
ncbi:heavy metal translocating P-type ATPase [Euryhalocaulis caribicus]|uniref:heavy metal translocating P-type ATPase n=1 Tax=Euryhalocaulis caribicus TaxID=1161401 RepID=UPI0012688CFD|nr:heavy metal translocating P-type ATPase [Euryhalocaulis caribicus]